MVSLLSFIGYFIPHASDCYLSPNIIDPANHAELRAISREIAEEEGMGIKKIEQELSCIPFTKKEASYVRKVTGSSKPIATSYCQFKNRLLNTDRIKKGATFYHKNKKALDGASAQYGVDPYVITAIIGSESIYGNFLGNANTKHALTDVAINTANLIKRNFFRKELKALIKLSIHRVLDINKLKGSWDGGFGLPQFMPSSYYHYAVSIKNKKPDLFDTEDAIYSIANYLNQHGFKQNAIIAKPAEYSEDINYRNESMLELHQASTDNYSYQFLMDNNDYEYWESGPNFYAISAYNPRPHYVISIHQLAKAIHEYIESTIA